MASHEHVQQLNDEEDTSSSDSASSVSSSDPMSDSSDGPQDMNTVDSMAESTREQSDVLQKPPKRRIKLSLRMPKKTLPEGDTSEPATATAPSVASASDVDDDVDEEVVTATIVPSDGEENEDMVEATVAEEAPAPETKQAASKAVQPKTKPAAPKSRRSPTPFLQAGRPVRLPPMSSPGLLIPPTAGVFRGNATADGFTTPASVFDRAMSLAGYSTEGRTRHPHRGSSVERVVGDMFDSNVLFSLHCPRLVPDELWSNLPMKPHSARPEPPVESMTPNDTGQSLPDMLIRAVSKNKKETHTEDMEDVHPSSGSKERKRKACSSLVDMAPVSLTISYPETYIQRRVEYVKNVQARERAIVASQEAAQAAEDAVEAYEDALAVFNRRSHAAGNGNDMNGSPVRPERPPQVEVPPIPVPPSPPRLSEMGVDPVEDADELKHPIYLPKGKEKFVSHLDKDCFHITNGRYYGLSTNEIADPHFVGPNAPGILGLNVSGGTGLATSYSGGSNASAAASSQAYYGRSVAVGSSGVTGGGGSKNPLESSKGSTAKKKPSPSQGSAKATTPKVAKKGTGIGPAATSTSTDLKKFMEQDDTVLVEQMKVCIIRAAVYASRTGMHGGSFIGPDGETYPDISKAFAAHAGLRPCNRCKNNKQGAYHCRLRRKHKDIDYDGGNSWGVLASLFDEPIEDLRQK